MFTVEPERRQRAAAVIALCTDQSGTLLIEMNLDASESLGESSAEFNYLRRRGVHSEQAAAVPASSLESEAGKHGGGAASAEHAAR